jgi:hypothetical protein
LGVSGMATFNSYVLIADSPQTAPSQSFDTQERKFAFPLFRTLIIHGVRSLARLGEKFSSTLTPCPDLDHMAGAQCSRRASSAGLEIGVDTLAENPGSPGGHFSGNSKEIIPRDNYAPISKSDGFSCPAAGRCTLKRNIQRCKKFSQGKPGFTGQHFAGQLSN